MEPMSVDADLSRNARVDEGSLFCACWALKTHIHCALTRLIEWIQPWKIKSHCSTRPKARSSISPSSSGPRSSSPSSSLSPASTRGARSAACSTVRSPACISIRRCLLLVRLVRLLVLALFLIMALQNLGVELLPLIAGLGVAGAGIALAMQGVLGNIVAGLTIIFTKPFRVGEYISIVGVEGQVESIELFSTRLSHADRSIVVVPNRKIVGEILHNYGQIRQLSLSVNIKRAQDVDGALAAVQAVVNANAAVLKQPAPLIGVTKLARAPSPFHSHRG